MDSARSRILDDFPTPVAYTYSLIFDEDRNASVRRWALCFTEYQALRLIALPLVGQYLRADLSAIDFPRDKAMESALRSLNKAIAGIRAPFFSDWITLVETLRRLDADPGADARYSLRLAPALKQLKVREPREFDLSGEQAARRRSGRSWPSATARRTGPSPTKPRRPGTSRSTCRCSTRSSRPSTSWVIAGSSSARPGRMSRSGARRPFASCGASNRASRSSAN